jgi:hypothetical protein
MFRSHVRHLISHSSCSSYSHLTRRQLHQCNKPYPTCRIFKMLSPSKALILRNILKMHLQRHKLCLTSIFNYNSSSNSSSNSTTSNCLLLLLSNHSRRHSQGSSNSKV